MVLNRTSQGPSSTVAAVISVLVLRYCKEITVVRCLRGTPGTQAVRYPVDFDILNADTGLNVRAADKKDK